jgi:hypothetical protein
MQELGEKGIIGGKTFLVPGLGVNVPNFKDNAMAKLMNE